MSWTSDFTSTSPEQREQRWTCTTYAQVRHTSKKLNLDHNIVTCMMIIFFQNDLEHTRKLIKIIMQFLCTQIGTLQFFVKPYNILDFISMFVAP